ncbi:hypothetical protein ABH926_010090 [Catenulispora sp. GP43]|uniref:hypothetical protein n=1 Tax=Catenulispora sp. GP43 TaxID=3156263 RepID=UPI003511E177
MPPGRYPGQHLLHDDRRELVFGSERLVGLELDLGAVDAAHQRPGDLNRPVAQLDRAALAAVKHRNAPGVVLATGPDQLLDLGV